MPDIDVNFHATPDELGEWVQGWVTIDSSIRLVEMLFPPISFKPITTEEVPATLSDSAASRISFIIERFDPSIDCQNDFDTRYSHQLRLLIGHLTPDGLGQSWLSCRTDNEQAFRTWKRIAKDLKKHTVAGLTGISRVNGVVGFTHQHRYSPGAKQLESGGIAILPFAGAGKGPMLRLGDVREDLAGKEPR